MLILRLHSDIGIHRLCVSKRMTGASLKRIICKRLKLNCFDLFWDDACSQKLKSKGRKTLNDFNLESGAQIYLSSSNSRKGRSKLINHTTAVSIEVEREKRLRRSRKALWPKEIAVEGEDTSQDLALSKWSLRPYADNPYTSILISPAMLSSFLSSWRRKGFRGSYSGLVLGSFQQKQIHASRILLRDEDEKLKTQVASCLGEEVVGWVIVNRFETEQYIMREAANLELQHGYADGSKRFFSVFVSRQSRNTCEVRLRVLSDEAVSMIKAGDFSCVNRPRLFWMHVSKFEATLRLDSTCTATKIEQPDLERIVASRDLSQLFSYHVLVCVAKQLGIVAVGRLFDDHKQGRNPFRTLQSLSCTL